ncbi:MAG TPA: VOC family protein [Trueperaceae bacterium]
MARVTHFEITADDPERASKFYAGVFDWKVNKWDGPEPYWLCATGQESEPGIDGAIMKRSARLPETVNTISVGSIEDTLTKIQEAGGSVLGPVQAIPGVGYHAYCRDTEGNAFGVIQNDPNAA